MRTLPASYAIVFLLSAVVICRADSPRLPVDQLPEIKELPDPFVFADGMRLKSPQEWGRRRAELVEWILTYEYGHLPPDPKNVKGEIVKSGPTTRPAEMPGATEAEILLTMGPESKVSTHLLLMIPEGPGPFPVILRGDLGWGRVKPEIAAAVIKRGYILAEFDRTQIAPDKDGRDTGIYAAYPDFKGGCMAAWAWGFHRATDYLLTRPDVNPKQIVVTGHSRGGKAALLAGALDERVALTVPNGSGCGGAGCYRVQPPKTEDLAAITKKFPFWFELHFGEFTGQVDRLPFDQHEVKSLVAPRALLTTDGLGDQWANGPGTQQTYLAAKVVFDFLGAGDKIGLHFRPGKHEQNIEDWTALLDFADVQFFGKKTERKFDVLPFPDSTKAFSWGKP